MPKQEKNAVWEIKNEKETKYFVNAEKAAEYLKVTRNAVHLSMKLGYFCKGYTVNQISLENIEIKMKEEK